MSKSCTFLPRDGIGPSRASVACEFRIRFTAFRLRFFFIFGYSTNAKSWSFRIFWHWLDQVKDERGASALWRMVKPTGHVLLCFHVTVLKPSEDRTKIHEIPRYRIARYLNQSNRSEPIPPPPSTNGTVVHRLMCQLDRSGLPWLTRLY